MTSERTPVTTADELASFDKTEVLDGYRDGLSGEPEPGDNRSKAYWHGWRNGRNDRAGIAEQSQRELVKDMRRPIPPTYVGGFTFTPSSGETQ